MNGPGARVTFQCVDRRIAIDCRAPELTDVLRLNFAPMRAELSQADLAYRVERARPGGFRVTRLDPPFQAEAATDGELVYALESDIVVQLQLRRPELLFLHAAVLVLGGRAHLLVGRSGGGKSTTCWGLTHHGLHYLSDELAPIDLRTGAVHAYTRALCLKRAPPGPHSLPADTLRTSRGLHVPIPDDRRHVGPPPVLATLFLVEYDPAARAPVLERVGRAEAAARLYPQILNALAHERDGLAAAAEVAGRVRAFRLTSADLEDSCRAVLDRIRGV